MGFHMMASPWQQVIYRNYGMVRNSRLAEILNTTEDVVLKEAEKLGLSQVEFDENWLKKGFVTIIRNNWEILSDRQIYTLLEISEKQYNILLTDYDFLDIKLGKKPDVKEPLYYPLDSDGEKTTKDVKNFTETHYIKEKVAPFDFYKGKSAPSYFAPKEFFVTDRYISCYSASYSGALLDDNLSDYSEDYLIRLKNTGVNGIWLHDTLRNLALFPFDPTYSPDYEIRIKNLRKLTERCSKYNINVYLYMNEPRSLPKSFFVSHPELRGQETENKQDYCLCTSVKDVKEYLYNAVKFIAENVPLLKGIMTITMSENPTHCYSRKWFGECGENITDCPHCKDRQPEEVVSEINNIFARALRDGNGRTVLIANLWAWADFSYWSEERIFHGIDLLDKDIQILCVSEFGKKFTRGNVNSQVIDYSISVPGPSEITEKMLSYAREKGHKIWAKVQVNNSWECSAVPYIPVFNLMTDHIERLKKLGVTGIMLGWSLGGYPGGALPLCNMYCGKDKPDVKKWYSDMYGENGKVVSEAVKCFSKAFSEYPFSIDVLYLGGHNLGCGNMWNSESDNRVSTMTGFTFDDYENYTKPYGLEIYAQQFRKLTDMWEKGIRLIDNKKGNSNFDEIVRISKVCYCQFRSAMLIAEFSFYKKNKEKNRDKLIELAKEEYGIAYDMYKFMAEDATIFFEMSNHYFVSRSRLLEKMLNLMEIVKELEK